ncbi:putative ribonuclease H-like domain-containing protein [Tanacetum coccineum]
METVSSPMVAAVKHPMLNLAEEKLARKNELKARRTLLMALPNEHQLKFNTYKCAQTLMEAIEKRFGGNKESRLQKLISQLEILGETISQEDMNLKFLRSLPSEWKTCTLIWRNKPDLDTLGIDDLYNNLKIYETKVKGSSSSNQNSQNVVFVSSNNSGCSNQIHGSNSANTDSMSDAIDADDLEEMDLKWQMAMLTMRARRFLNKTGRKISANGYETIRFNKSKVECYNCHKRGHFTRECRAPRENKNREAVRRNVIVETTKTKALVSQDGIGYDWSDQTEEGPTNFALMAYTSSGSSSSSSLDFVVSTSSKACLKSYETLKEHYDNLTKDFNKSQLNVGAYKAGLESVEARLDVYKKNEVVIEEDIKILKLDIMLRDNPLTELRKKFEKAKKERDNLKLILKKIESSSKNLSKLLEIQVSDKFKTGVGFDSQVFDSQGFVSQGFNSQVFDSQVNDKYKTGVGYHAVPPPYTRNFMPPKPNLILVDMDEYVVSESVTSVHVVATCKAKTSESKPKYVSEPLIKDWISDSRWNLTKSKSKQRKPSFAKVEFVKPNEQVKSPRKSVQQEEHNRQAKHPRKNSQSLRGNKRNWNNLMTQKLGSNFEFKNKAWPGNPQLKLQEKGVIDSGCSRPIIGNMSYLSEYEEINGGYVAFWSKTQMEGKITGGLTCFFAKATLDESNLWHRRLGYINFKDYEQMVRGSSKRCPVIILNTLDHLGKFDWKAEEGFFVGYSMNNKAFGVFNSRTRIVEETLHITFLENKPNVAGSGPTWLFDIDTLIKSMNYKLVVAGNQSNGNAGTKENIDAGHAGKKTVPDQEYILLPLWIQDPPFSSTSKDSPDAGFKPSGEEKKKDSEDLGNKDSEVPSTQEPRVSQEKDANVNNTNNITTVSPTINGAGIEDKSLFMRLCIMDVDDELLQFKLQQVWTLVDLPYIKRGIGTKWIYRNKKDERGIMVRNKARIEAIRLFLAYASFKDFVLYQMDAKIVFLYDKIEEEVYVYQPPGFEDPEFPDRVYKDEKALYGPHQALRAWYETLSTYLLDNGYQRSQIDKTLFIKRVKGDILLVQVYVDDIIFGSTKKVLCTEFEKLMHKKFQMSSIVKTASTPTETSKPLMKDENDEDVDVHTNIRSMIYLKGQPKLGLWYPKDSPFDLVAYTDSDYTGASLDRKSTIGGCQFLGCRLISVQCKEADCGDNSHN